MRLVQNWRAVLRYAWSIRINIGLAILSGVDGAVTYVVDGKLSSALIVFAVSVSASIARVVAQPTVAGDTSA